jgi:hypothetical protein
MESSRWDAYTFESMGRGNDIVERRERLEALPSEAASEIAAVMIRRAITERATARRHGPGLGGAPVCDP